MIKQIDIAKTYAQKRCLIVDNSPEERTAIKRLLMEFGCEQIDMAGSAEEAIDVSERKRYDMVISDYGLGSGKNGQQLIEELRFNQFLKNTAVYILLTQEKASQYVLHALAYQPDDYLGKPVSRDALRQRLNAAILRKDALISVNEALDENKPDKAIETCRKLLHTQTKFKLDVCKILGELLIQTKQFSQAHQMYNSLQTNKAPIWAKLGLARSFFGVKQFDQAEEAATNLIEEAPLCVDAHELLARILDAKNLTIQAQHRMSEAVKLTPHSVDRQRFLGQLSNDCGDQNAALHAFTSAVKHSRRSCHESFEDYINLSETALKLSKRSTPSKGIEYLKKAEEINHKTDKKFNRQPLAQLRSYLIKADIAEIKNQPQIASKHIDESLIVLDDLTENVLEHSSVEFNISCAQALITRGKYDEGEKLLKQIAKNNTDTTIAIEIDKLMREPISKEGIAFAAKLNKKGIDLYAKKKFHESVNAFKEVLRELPNHIGLNLNLVQAIVSKSANKALSNDELTIIDSCMKKMAEIDEPSKYFERYNYLKKQHTKIKSELHSLTH